jgi:hypothetical protein
MVLRRPNFLAAQQRPPRFNIDEFMVERGPIVMPETVPIGKTAFLR